MDVPLKLPDLRHLRKSLHTDHGPLWRYKLRLLLVFGEPEELEAVAPTLATHLWLEGPGCVLLWAGSLHADPADSRMQQWRSLTRWRPLDGAIWAMTQVQIADPTALNAGIRRLQRLSRKLGWQLPLHLWQVGQSDWNQPTRASQPAGIQVPEKFTPDLIAADLHSLLQPLRDKGWEQTRGDLRNDFLLRLSRDLGAEGIERWKKALTPHISKLTGHLALRGLWFSLPLERPHSELPHHWLLDPAWNGILNHRARTPRWRGKQPVRMATLGFSTLAALWFVGMLVSFTSNQRQGAKVEAAWAAVQSEQTNPTEQLTALNELMHWLAKVDDHVQHGAPWYQRFGLDRNPPLLDATWPRFVEANNRLIRDPAAANLQQQLSALIKLAPDSPERAQKASAAYDQLKAYLMMANPEHTDPAFLAQALESNEPEREGIVQGRWLYLAPQLWNFYARQLHNHPELRIQPDSRLITQARQVLLGQLGQRNGEAALYSQVLDTVAGQYADLNLTQLTGTTDPAALFTSQHIVPGMFTRQAWEGQVRQAIDEVAEARREQIDWVLSEGQKAHTEVSPDALKARLTARYFQDYSNAWLNFLNSLRWQPVRSMGDAIDQLTLMSDIRQSPLIALMNTLAYQGQAGQRGLALKDSLIESAQKLVRQQPAPVFDQSQALQSGPLDPTFGPLLALLGKDPQATPDTLSLQAFLTRVTRVRLKLQQVGNAPDPQAMTQALAQTVFQGKDDDLTSTQAYGSLLAASLGAEWGGIGQTLFVQPLEQAWQRVLQPSAASLNTQWQRAVVDHWQSAFAGRFPFAPTASDASLPMLGQMIRSDSGRIEQFLREQLNGILRKEGDRWVADPRQSQGLRINPAFLGAVNQLSHLADVLYTDGGMGMNFELSGKPVRDIVQTSFVLDGQKHHYFNQKEGWQRFKWPGLSPAPGASLTWTSVHTGERLYGDYQGIWGLIRLFEQAKVTPLDDGDSRFKLTIKAPDGIDLTWHLRTEMGTGPLALLKLKGFTLPREIFLLDKRIAKS
jgi:type VI secretion system protein ImpL